MHAKGLQSFARFPHTFDRYRRVFLRDFRQIINIRLMEKQLLVLRRAQETKASVLIVIKNRSVHFSKFKSSQMNSFYHPWSGKRR